MTFCPYCFKCISWWSQFFGHVAIAWHRGQYKETHSRCFKARYARFDYELEVPLVKAGIGHE